MKVAAGDDFSAFGEDERIVRDAVRFSSERTSRLPQKVEHRTHNLWLAPQAIWILNSIIVGQVGSSDCAALHERAQGSGDFDLPPVSTKALNARVKRPIRTFGGV